MTAKELVKKLLNMNHGATVVCCLYESSSMENILKVVQTKDKNIIKLIRCK